jgi:hypothetical protein
VNDRGEYGDRVRVSGFGDRLKLTRLTADFDETYQAVVDQAKTRPEWSSWLAGVEPIFKGWFAFRKGSSSESIDPVSYQLWSDQLAAIRAGAKSRGMKIPAGIGAVAVVGGLALLGGVAVVAAFATRSHA